MALIRCDFFSDVLVSKQLLVRGAMGASTASYAWATARIAAAVVAGALAEGDQGPERYEGKNAGVNGGFHG